MSAERYNQYNDYREDFSERDEAVAEIRLGLQNHYETNLLVDPTQILELPAITDTESREEIMSGCINQTEKVSQYLRCIIKAGTELISCVDVITKDDQEKPYHQTILTRFIPGKRAEFVGFLDRGVQPINYGRESLNKDNRSVSRLHFAIAEDKQGNIGISDTGSTNHTEVFTANENPFGDESVKNPVEQFQLWSLKSAQVKEVVLDRYQALYQNSAANRSNHL